MQQTLQPNTLLQGGKYRIIEPLGQGGFGITYLGEQIALGRKVAIKEFFMKDLCNRDEATSHVSVGSEGSREMVNRFRMKFVKEAKSIARLEHPNIVRVIDIFEENGTAYYVMEYCEGGSLSAKLRQQYHTGMPSELALKYIRQIASALDYIHQLKINHLDVKPANIMLNKRSDAVLIDFGLAKQYDAETGNQTSSTPVGISEGYAPIEQYKKGGVGTFSAATDIYALSATLYKLVTGLTPPSADDVFNEGLPTLSSSVPANIVKAIAQGMQPRKLDRPQSIGAWMKLLDEETVIVDNEYDETTHIHLEQEKAEQERLRKEAERNAAREKAEEEARKKAAKEKAEAEARAKAEKERKTREEAERKQKSSSASKKLWLWGIAAVIALALVWLVWPNSDPITVRSGTNNGHDFVDLGLKDSKGRPIYWATCNIGATKPEDYGLYFAWGETKGYASSTKDGRKFDWYDYKWGNGSYDTMTKYCIESKYGSVDNKTVLDPEDDAARVNWGGDWRMPTKAEQDQLRTKCKWTWDSTKKGYMVKGLNGNSIFLPAAGYRSDEGLRNAGSRGYYWSSSLCSSSSDGAFCFYFYSGYVDWLYGNRCYGRSVRAVCVPSE